MTELDRYDYAFEMKSPENPDEYETKDVCDCCGSDGILNRDLPPEQQAPIWTIVTFRGAPGFANPDGLVYFKRKVCSDCNNRWQLMLLNDVEEHAEEARVS